MNDFSISTPVHGDATAEKNLYYLVLEEKSQVVHGKRIHASKDSEVEIKMLNKTPDGSATLIIRAMRFYKVKNSFE